MVYYIHNLADDQVACMWSSNGTEYSGRTDVTCAGVQCVPWYRSIHKLKKALDIEFMYTESILDKFPDHSLSEAHNYCRNPTKHPCGPWCYTSLVDDSNGTCCVPDCTAANKGFTKISTHLSKYPRIYIFKNTSSLYPPPQKIKF